MALTNRQKNLIEYMIAHPERPETVCANECGVPNSTYFNWKHKEEFMNALDNRIKEVWKDSERMAVNQMIELSSGGCFQATKYILDNLGYKPIERVEASVNSDINIILDDLDLDNFQVGGSDA